MKTLRYIWALTQNRRAYAKTGRSYIHVFESALRNTAAEDGELYQHYLGGLCVLCDALDAHDREYDAIRENR